MAIAADIMTRDVVTVTAETPLRDVAALLSTKRFGSVPVVDSAGHLLGIVTEEDMVSRAADIRLPRYIPFLGGIIYLENPQHFSAEAEKILAVTAGEIMETDAVTIPPDTPVDLIASRMLDEDLRRMLVLDDQSRLLGIITRADIVRMLLTQQQLPEREAE